MNIALIGFILIVVSLLLVLFYLLKMNSDKSRKAQNELKNNNNNSAIIDLNTMQFPKNIEHMKFDLLSKATKIIFDSYNNKLQTFMYIFRIGFFWCFQFYETHVAIFTYFPKKIVLL